LKFSEIRTEQDIIIYTNQFKTNETGVLKVDNTYYIYDKYTKRIIEIIKVK